MNRQSILRRVHRIITVQTQTRPDLLLDEPQLAFNQCFACKWISIAKRVFLHAGTFLSKGIIRLSTGAILHTWTFRSKGIVFLPIATFLHTGTFPFKRILLPIGGFLTERVRGLFCLCRVGILRHLHVCNFIRRQRQLFSIGVLDILQICFFIWRHWPLGCVCGGLVCTFNLPHSKWRLLCAYLLHVCILLCFRIHQFEQGWQIFSHETVQNINDRRVKLLEL
mmetsp:Transcript_30158/g.54832  ORF Transcript_30158/g.54832 Transcript_30158/m.54832 type:complete len:223 (-) Transcript_30158:357-1025(-)